MFLARRIRDEWRKKGIKMVDRGIGILYGKISISLRGGGIINDNGFVIAGINGYFLVTSYLTIKLYG
jgi:hypothetical protein